MTTGVALLSREQIERLPERARDVVEYRKSGRPPEQVAALIRDRLLTFFASSKERAEQAVITECLTPEIEQLIAPLPAPASRAR